MMRSYRHDQHAHRRWARLCAGTLIAALTIGSETVLSAQVAGAITMVTVTNCSDSGAGSLRDAVATSPAGATIKLVPFGCDEIMLSTGPIDITQSHTIKGPGIISLTVSGGNVSSVFLVESGVTATISGLAISGGNASGTFGYGGGIYDLGTLTVSKSQISFNNAPGGYGGGIYDAGGGTLSVFRSAVYNNTAIYGGGIFSQGGGTLSVSSSYIANNSANGGGGGVFTNNGGSGSVTVSKSTFLNNSAPGTSGGGIFNTRAMTVSKSKFLNNTAATGGGIYNYPDATLSVDKSKLSNNSATQGGAIDNDGTLSVSNSKLRPGNTGSSNVPNYPSIFSSTTPTITHTKD